MIQQLQGDVRDVLPTLPADSRMSDIPSDYLRLTINTDVADKEHDELTLEYESGAAWLLTITAVSSHPPDRETATAGINRDQAQRLLTFLTMVVPMMTDYE